MPCRTLYGVRKEKFDQQEVCNTISYQQDVYDRMEDIWVNLTLNFLRKLFKVQPRKLQKPRVS
ncbi:hypothetical protein K457DRAFT_137291 [Linnemannia elongata AG-77]|uniref:Uncharacterized protein n=1 Tax=Linnemannia elongata AG-77 TaxID=1314771 RepID=A0A197JZ25_9FUNG|nr:hypothetical protein K457DRAFT_137291 [Linnemannia elongata AG-77]